AQSDLVQPAYASAIVADDAVEGEGVGGGDLLESTAAAAGVGSDDHPADSVAGARRPAGPQHTAVNHDVIGRRAGGLCAVLIQIAEADGPLLDDDAAGRSNRRDVQIEK